MVPRLAGFERRPSDDPSSLPRFSHAWIRCYLLLARHGEARASRGNPVRTFANAFLLAFAVEALLSIELSQQAAAGSSGLVALGAGFTALVTLASLPIFVLMGFHPGLRWRIFLPPCLVMSWISLGAVPLPIWFDHQTKVSSVASKIGSVNIDKLWCSSVTHRLLPGTINRDEYIPVIKNRLRRKWGKLHLVEFYFESPKVGKVYVACPGEKGAY